MKVFSRNIKEIKNVKNMLSHEEYSRELTQLIRRELNSKDFISLGEVASKVVKFSKSQGDRCMTFMTAMDLVDVESQKILSALKECAI